MRLSITAALAAIATVTPASAQPQPRDEPKDQIPIHRESIVVRGAPVEVQVERRNADTVRETLFSRDDQLFHLLDGGLNAGQHEGGGKSLEIRRFGYNLDHGGVGGGLKVLTDGMQQNLGTQGHGQGYLGNLKGLTPELIDEVQLINGPFSAEYGDFSGLGVVHITLRESLPDEWTIRLQRGQWNTSRGMIAWSPFIRSGDGLLAYEGSLSDGPFQNPMGYRRDNVTGNLTRRFGERSALSLKSTYGRNRSLSSGQLPVDEIAAGRLDRFGFLDPTQGVRAWNGAAALHFRRQNDDGSIWKWNGFVARNLFDLYSNFTYFLNDPVNGDAIQQHDSRLQQGSNLQYLRPHRMGRNWSYLSAGANFHANQINVGLYPRTGREPRGVTTRAHAAIENGAGYAQENVSLLGGKLLAGGGIRWDAFRFGVDGQSQRRARSQPKANAAYTPLQRIPLTVFANYGRGISTTDARAVIRRPDAERVAITDFTQAGLLWRWTRVSLSASAFNIARSNELVYVPDDATLEFRGPSRSYGWESKASMDITRRISVNGGVTKVSNAYYSGEPRVYVDSAPHFVANAGLTLSAWRGWVGSFRMRAINRYRLDGEDPSIVAQGHTVFDLWITRKLNRHIDLSVAVDNLLDRRYWEMQNFYESRLEGQHPIARIHATPGYGRTVIAGATFRFRGK